MPERPEPQADLNELLATATERAPWQPGDTKSGARFERVVIEGSRYVLKYQDPKDDWLLRATGDPGARYVRLWEEGLLDRLPDVIDAAVVAADFDGAVGRVLLRDITDALLPADQPFSEARHSRFLDHMAALHAAFWGWKDDVGLTPLAVRYLTFSPTVAAAEAALGSDSARAPGDGHRLGTAGGDLPPPGRVRPAALRGRWDPSSTRSTRCRTPSCTATGKRPTSAVTPMGAPCCSTSGRSPARPRRWPICPGIWR